jgi:hypothetical protein
LVFNLRPLLPFAKHFLGLLLLRGFRLASQTSLALADSETDRALLSRFVHQTLERRLRVNLRDASFTELSLALALLLCLVVAHKHLIALLSDSNLAFVASIGVERELVSKRCKVKLDSSGRPFHLQLI